MPKTSGRLAPVKCPSCGGDSELRGPICDANWFAGRQLDFVLKGGELRACVQCSLNFRWPTLPKSEYDRLYEAGYEKDKGSNWIHEPENRLDWLFAKDIINKNSPNKNILDVGCFDGSFLRSLGRDYNLYGVEINREASRRARLNGVRLVSNNYSDIDTVNIYFGSVVAMNVIEHVQDPLELLRKMYKLVVPGGIIIISSGNTEAWSWKLLGSNYWYCHPAGHIAFINPTWCRIASKALGLQIAQIKSFPHHPSNFFRRASESIVNMSVGLAPWILRLARSQGFGGIDTIKFPTLITAPLGWMSANDHIAVIFKKPLVQSSI